MWIVWLLSVCWGRSAEQLMFAGDVAGALKAAQAEASTAPEDVEAQERYVDLLLNLYLVDEAIALAQKRIENAPQDPNAHYLMGRAVPDVNRARRSYERALKLDPTHGRSHMGMGAIYTARQDPSRAAGAYGRAVRSDPSLGEAWLGLSRAHIGLEQIDEALEVCRRAMAALPSHPDAYLTASILDPEHARSILERAVRNASQDARVHAALSDLLLNAGEAKKARAEAERALAINPGEPVALRVQFFAGEVVAKRLNTAGYQQLVKARSSPTIEPHDALVARYPKSAAVFLGRSWALRSKGRDALALDDLLVARRLAPNEAEVAGQLGLLLLDRKRPKEAVPVLEQAHKARPWDLSLSMAWASAMSLSGQHPEAIEVYHQLVRRSPYNTALAIAYADALLRANKREAAYQVILKAAEHRMSEQIVVALMATAAQAGRFNEAADIMQQIADRTGDPKAATLAQQLRAKAQ